MSIHTRFVWRAPNKHRFADKPGIFIYCRCSRTPLSRITFPYFVVTHSWPAAMSAVCILIYRMRKDYALVIR